MIRFPNRKILFVSCLSFLLVCAGCKSPSSTQKVELFEPEVILEPDPQDYARIASGECPDCNLQGIRMAPLKLPNANMQNINFERAVLRGVDFSGANLTGANLQYADLRRIGDPASLRGADLTDADLSNSNLHLAKLTNATLKNVNFSKANLIGSDLRGVTLEGADFTGALYDETTTTDIDLSQLGAHLLGPQGNLAGININRYLLKLAGRDLNGAELSKANLSYMTITGTSLANANMQEANLQGVLITKDVDLINTDLSRTNLTDADLRGVDLSATNLDQAKLTGAFYDNETRFPDSLKPEEKGALLLESGSDLTGQDLSGRYLIGELDGLILKDANLNSAMITGVLSNTDLRGAQLQNAMIKADLKGSDLGGADFSNAFIDSDFRDTNITGTTFTNAAVATHSILRAKENFWFPEGFFPNQLGVQLIDLSQKVNSVDTYNSTFTERDFSDLPPLLWRMLHMEERRGMDYMLSSFFGARFLNFTELKVIGKERNAIYLFETFGTILNNSTLTNVDWSQQRFTKSGFQEAELKNVDLSYATFIEPNFYKAKFRNVNLYGAGFLPTTLGSNFEAYLKSVEACMVTLPQGQMIIDGC